MASLAAVAPKGRVAHFRELLAHDDSMHTLLCLLCVVGYVGAAFMWLPAIQSTAQGAVAEGMFSWMILGSMLLFYQLHKTWLLVQNACDWKEMCRYGAVLMVVLLNATGNLIVIGIMIWLAAKGSLPLARLDLLNIVVNLLFVGSLVVYASRPVRRLPWLGGLPDLAFEAALLLCLFALFTRVEPGLMMIFSGSLHLLPESMLVGWVLVALQRCAMTGLQYNRAVIDDSRRPTHQTGVAVNINTWILRTDILNAMTGTLLWGVCQFAS